MGIYQSIENKLSLHGMKESNCIVYLFCCIEKNVLRGTYYIAHYFMKHLLHSIQRSPESGLV